MALSIMEWSQFLTVLFLANFILCVHSSNSSTNYTSSTNSLDNSTKLVNVTSPIHYGCRTCNLTANTVCVDGDCYCGPNFYWSPTYQTCQVENCYSNSDCYQPQDPMRQCVSNWCVCYNNYYEDLNNGRKCTYRGSFTTTKTTTRVVTLSPKTTTYRAPTTTTTTQQTPTQQTTTEQDSFVVYNNCTYCYKYNNLVCIDKKCYCAPNYMWDPNSKNCWYSSCYSDRDCYEPQDIERHCNRGGLCECNTNYFEDWTNGRKCTFRLNIWTWVWVFFLIPIVAIIFGITMCLRKRRAHQAHSHLLNTPQEPPPSYGSEQGPSFVRK